MSHEQREPEADTTILYPVGHPTQTQCCDCGLVHQEVYEVLYAGTLAPVQGQFIVRVRCSRDDLATVTARRQMAVRVTPSRRKAKP